MQDLPMAPASCALDGTALAEQLDRYRAVGRHCELVARDPRRIVVQVGTAVPGALVAELIAVERSCCPFFDLDWRPRGRRLTVAVREAEHEQALAAIVAALAPGSERAA
jgi:hypothetical protein